MIDGTRYGWMVGAWLARVYQGPEVYTQGEARKIGMLALENLREMGVAASLLYPEEQFITNLAESFYQGRLRPVEC